MEKTDNELIAKFMGWTQHDKVKEWMNVPKGQDLHFKAWKLRKDSLLFNESWDWLMPVVEKIETMDRTLVNIYGDGTVIAVDNEGLEIYGKTTHGNKDDKIQHVYRAIVDFIKWYNENRQP